MNDRVTWLLPVRNGMPYLPETLASIEAQTYHNWEILVWDDGSTDGTLEELEKWIPSRLPGKIFTGESLGVGGALARLVEACETELCARIDADDINLPKRLEKQVAYMQKHPEITVLGSAMYRINEQGDRYKYSYRFPQHHDNIVILLLSETCIGHPSVMFRKSAILDIGNYRSLPKVEDYDLWLRVASRYKLANLPEFLVEYRIRSNSETQIVKQENRIEEVMRTCLYQHVEILFGCSVQDIALLVEKHHPNPIKILLKILFFLKKSQGGSWIGRLLSDSFFRVSKNVLESGNLPARIALAMLEILPSTLIRKFLQLPHRFIFKFSSGLPG